MVVTEVSLSTTKKFAFFLAFISPIPPRRKPVHVSCTHDIVQYRDMSGANEYAVACKCTSSPMRAMSLPPPLPSILCHVMNGHCVKDRLVAYIQKLYNCVNGL